MSHLIKRTAIFLDVIKAFKAVSSTVIWEKGKAITHKYSTNSCKSSIIEDSSWVGWQGGTLKMNYFLT